MTHALDALNAQRAPAELITLNEVNLTPAQTWNWLGMNATTLVAPREPKIGEAKKQRDESTFADTLPRWALDARTACGNEAKSWLSRSSTCTYALEVDAKEPQRNIIRLGGPEEHFVSNVAVRTKAGASASILVVATGSVSTTGNLLQLIAAAGSSLNVDILIARQDGAQHLQAVSADLAEDASLAIRTWILGGTKTAYSVAADLKGTSSTFSSELHYLAGMGETVDVTYDIRQYGHSTEATINASGVLTKGASKTLRASIDLVRGCKGSQGSETETVLIAGDAVHNQTLPIILCSEDDVQGNHGATIGSLSAEQQNFLASRGLSEQDVVELMAQAVIDDAAGQLPAQITPSVVSWARAARGNEAAAQAADASALVYGTLCDPFDS